MARQQTLSRADRLTSLVLAMVSAMMLAAPGSSVTGMKGRDEAPEAEGVRADDGVTASSEEGTCSNKHTQRCRDCDHDCDRVRWTYILQHQL